MCLCDTCLSSYNEDGCQKALGQLTLVARRTCQRHKSHGHAFGDATLGVYYVQCTSAVQHLTAPKYIAPPVQRRYRRQDDDLAQYEIDAQQTYLAWLRAFEAAGGSLSHAGLAGWFVHIALICLARDSS